MPFSEKLTELMQQHKITAQQISKQSNTVVNVSDIRRFQNEGGCPSSYQMTWLTKIFGIDMELFLNPTPKHQIEPVRTGISMSDFGKTEEIKKPGAKVKSSKIKNSITRIHSIPKPDSDKIICGNCFQLSESCRYCHPEDSEIKMMLGGPGTGEKNPDELCALLCDKCTLILDKKPNKEDSRLIKLEHTMLWSKAVIFSQAMRIAELENKHGT